MPQSRFSGHLKLNPPSELKIHTCYYTHQKENFLKRITDTFWKQKMFTLTAPALKDAVAPSWTFLGSGTKPWSTQRHRGLGGSFTVNGPESHRFLVLLSNCGSLRLHAGHTEGRERGAVLEPPGPMLFAAPFQCRGATRPLHDILAWSSLCRWLNSHASWPAGILCSTSMSTQLWLREQTPTAWEVTPTIQTRICFKCRQMTTALQCPRSLPYLFFLTHVISLY